MLFNIATQTSLLLPILVGFGVLTIDDSFVEITQAQTEQSVEAAAMAGGYSMEHEVILINESTFPLRIDKIVSSAETCEIESYQKEEKKPGEKFHIRVKQKKIPIRPGEVNTSFLEIWFKNPQNEETYCKVEMRRKTIGRQDE